MEILSKKYKKAGKVRIIQEKIKKYRKQEEKTGKDRKINFPLKNRIGTSTNHRTKITYVNFE